MHYFTWKLELILNILWKIAGEKKQHSTSADTSVTRAIRVQHKQHECGTSAARERYERHECNMSEKYWFSKRNEGKHVFTPYISHMANERLQGEEQYHSKNYLLAVPHSHTKNVQSAPQILNFVIAKAISKRYTLNCSCKWPCTFPHS